MTDPRRSLLCPHRQFPTLPGLLDSQVALRNSYPKISVPSKEPVCTIFMMILVMTTPGCDPMTHIRGGHANHYAIATRYMTRDLLGILFGLGLIHYSAFSAAKAM